MAVFFDRDGSVSGGAGQSIVATTPFLDDGGCQPRAEWNAAVCPGAYGLIALQDLTPGAEPIAPVVLSRVDGVSVRLDGFPDLAEFAAFVFAPVRPGASYDLGFGNERPDRLRIFYARPPLATETEDVILQLPWSGDQVYVYAAFDGVETGDVADASELGA